MKPAQAALVGVFVLALLAVFHFDLFHWLSLAVLQQRRQEVADYYALHPALLRAAFFLFYLVYATLALPGVLFLSLAAGAVFGFGWGLLLVSLASSLGGTLSFWSARFVLCKTVHKYFGERLAPINRGLQRHGHKYLFSMRLIPMVPFFAINLALGLTTMSSWTFYWVTLVGMLAANSVYVSAGQQLGRLHQLSDALQPGLVGALLLLALLPLGAARLQRWRAQRSAC